MNLIQIYKNIRTEYNYRVPAVIAHNWAKKRQKIEAWTKRTCFTWEDKDSELVAHWSQDGFDLTAKVISDDNGWWEYGIESYGKFTSNWEPGAIPHRSRRMNEHEWFIPVDPANGKYAYTRACRYGLDWWYVGIIVTVYKAGVELAETSVWGIESDSEEEFFTEIVFDSTVEAIAEARQVLCSLCS